MIVMKFGGSSVESAVAIQRVASIVHQHLQRKPVVVVSAMGKTTDRLLGIARQCAAGNQKAAWRELNLLRHFHIREAFGSPASIHRHFDELEEILDEVTVSGALTPRLSDAVLAFGERLSSLIVTEAFRRSGIDAVHLDSRAVIVTDAHHASATPLYEETNARLQQKISPDRVTVMGGFIGATPEGVTTTLGRGGSDFSAAIVGAALGAEEIQIWTDVDGMLTCDPRIVPDARCLQSISYCEAEEMAKFGAKVLHPATVLPAIRERIPIAIRNSRNSSAPGTLIIGESIARDGAILSIACKSAVSVLHIRPRNAAVTPDFGRAIWEAFQSAGVSFELISPAVSQFSLVVDTAALTEDFRAQLLSLADVTIEDGRALITAIGRNASRHKRNIMRASARLAALAGGAALTSCTDSHFGFVIAAEALHTAGELLHAEFFSEPDPALFVSGRHTVFAFDKSQAKASGRAHEFLAPALN